MLARLYWSVNPLIAVGAYFFAVLAATRCDSTSNRSMDYTPRRAALPHFCIVEVVLSIVVAAYSLLCWRQRAAIPETILTWMESLT